jgi:hypothetical protein
MYAAYVSIAALRRGLLSIFILQKPAITGAQRDADPIGCCAVT